MSKIIGFSFPFSKYKMITLNYSFSNRQISDMLMHLLEFNLLLVCFCFLKLTLYRNPGCSGFALAEGVRRGGFAGGRRWEEGAWWGEGPELSGLSGESGLGDEAV